MVSYELIAMEDGLRRRVKSWDDASPLSESDHLTTHCWMDVVTVLSIVLRGQY
jgi:hypothetical protein